VPQFEIAGVEQDRAVRPWVRYLLLSIAVFVVGYAIFFWFIFEPR